MAHRELWSRTRLGSKVSVTVSPAGDEVGIGITNTLARTGVANFVTLEDAAALHAALGELLGVETHPAMSTLYGIVRERIFGDGTDACEQRVIDLCWDARKAFGIERD